MCDRAILTSMNRPEAQELTCSFCGTLRSGGLTGPEGAYVCSECIQLATEIIDLQGSLGNEPEAP